MRPRHFFSLGALVSVVILLALAAAWRLATRSHKPSGPSSPIPAVSVSSAVASSTNSIPGTLLSQALPASSVAGSSTSDIQFIAPQKIAEANFSDKEAGPETDSTDTSYVFYRVGRFVGGPNQGAELLAASVSQIAWPCKGDCGEPVMVRYIQKDKVVFPLPRISDPQAPAETVGRGRAVDGRPFEKFGATAGHPSDFSLPLLEYPQTIAPGARATLQRANEGLGVLNSAVLQLAFHDPIYGDVWMTRPGLGPQRPFYDECKDVNPKADASEAGCQGLPTYTDNAFYFFRPDGSYLSYVYHPEFHPDDSKQVGWKDGPLPQGTAYVDHSLVGCSGAGADAISVVSPASVSEADLEPIAKVNATGDPLYGLKDKNHRLYKEFYAAYDSSFPSWGMVPAQQASYDAFVKARPLFLWKDPFGRFIRFVNTTFVRPIACEPILYLYPPQTETIQVKLGGNVTVFDSYPPYREGWSITAHPDGRLTELRSGRSSPYLFWEGHSFILPPANQGFVVSSPNVPDFLGDVLPRLGLNEKETADFTAAWAAKLTGAPYYLISFVDEPVIDQYFPLRITPAPDTTIRVFMDFTPLSNPISVDKPVLLPPPQRQGFTVVEWGVLVR